MTDKEILTKAIDKVLKNGWQKDKVVAITNFFCIKHRRLYLTHSFAKAFWGEMGYSILNQNINDWQYHLQQMVIEASPIQYLRQFI